MIKTLICAAAVLVAATPAIAASTGDVASAEVRTDDLDLTDPADQRRLDTRIDTTARRICAAGVRGLAAVRAEQRCVALALGSAAPQAQLAIAQARGAQRLARIEIRIAG